MLFWVPPPSMLAQDWKITPVIEFRSRLERRLERDQSRAANDNRSELAHRLRVGATFAQGKEVTGRFVYQLGHSLLYPPALNRSEEHSDVFEANLAFKGKDGTVTVGRQTIRKGAGRLFDESNFSQRPKSWDAIRVRSGRFDGFVGRVGMTSNERDFSKVVGASWNSQFGESMVVYKRDDGAANVRVWTLDHRWSQNRKGLNLSAEGAIQRGKVGTKNASSFWLHGRVEKALEPKTTVYGEFNVASGGGTATETRLFDSLYGTGHTPYGLMDIQVLRNMRHLELGVSHRPDSRLTLGLSWNLYKLYDPRDGWYQGDSIARRPGGTFRDATGNSGTDVGSEFNLSASYKLTARDTLSLELGLFKPGGFVRKLNGANTVDQTWALISYTTRF